MMSENLKLVKLSDASPKGEGYYFCILHNSHKEKLWFSFKYGFETEGETVFGWYSDEVEVWSEEMVKQIMIDVINEFEGIMEKDGGFFTLKNTSKILKLSTKKHIFSPLIN